MQKKIARKIASITAVSLASGLITVPAGANADLTPNLQIMQIIDLQKKETARASMRKMVKHLLKKYKYPSEDYDTAISTVISQCEMWTDKMMA